MPKPHNMYQFMINCESWLSSPSVKKMRSSQRGMFMELLINAWLCEDSGLPTGEFELRQMARPDDDQQWNRDWPVIQKEFYKEKGKYYNKTLRILFDKSLKSYKTAVTNGKKGGRRKEPRKNPTLNPTLNPEGTQTLRQPTTYNLQLTKDNIQEPTAVGDVLDGSFLRTLGGNPETLENRCQAIVGNQAWLDSQNWFKWILDVLPDHYEASDAIKYVEDRMNDAVRESKGQGSALTNPAGLLTSKLKELAKKYGIANKTFRLAGLYVQNNKVRSV